MSCLCLVLRHSYASETLTGGRIGIGSLSMEEEENFSVEKVRYDSSVYAGDS